MTTPVASNQREAIAAREVLEGLEQLHELVMVTDRNGDVVWRSEALGKVCKGGEQALGRNLQQAEAGLSHLQVELPRESEVPLSMDVSALRVRRDEVDDPLTVAVVRPSEQRTPPPSGISIDTEAGRMLEQAPDGVLYVDCSGFITYANPAVEKLIGHTPAELLDSPVGLLLARAEDLTHLASRLRELKESSDQEILARGADGGEIWLSISSRPLFDAEGRAAGVVVFLRDASGRRRTREDLERKVATLESTVHGICHDLRSPLVSLLGFTRLLREDYGEGFDDTGRHFVHRIEQAGYTMQALMDDLLELLRIGGANEKCTLVDPRAVLLQLQAELKPRLDEQQVRLKLPSNPPLLLCDRMRLYQIFSNLLGNALHHMGDRPSAAISVQVVEDGSLHRISVRDNGRGIEADDQERIFEPFRTLGPKVDGAKSTGIGLAIVRRIAEAHGGRVWVESEPGRGACFHVTLPRG